MRTEFKKLEDLGLRIFFLGVQSISFYALLDDANKKKERSLGRDTVSDHSNDIGSTKTTEAKDEACGSEPQYPLTVVSGISPQQQTTASTLTEPPLI